MPIKNMEEMIQAGLDRAVELMALAAWTSFRFNDRNTIKMVTVTGEDELTPVAEYCFSLGDMSPLGARDGRHLAQLLKEPTALLLLGDKRKSDFNYNCGACGYKTCAEMNKAEEVESLTSNGPSCMFKNLNVSIAANAAAAMAYKLGLHCRVFSTLGFAARALDLIPDTDVVVGVSVSAGKKNPYFDRHEYWTQEHWDEIFDKEFPTFNRGFIGAIEE
jgi:uncharacterized ferredoxin-like protein